MTQKTIGLDTKLAERFATIVGERYAVRDSSDIEPYVHEPRGLSIGTTALVLQPDSVEEVSAIMRLATETCTSVVPQGGNTGLVGGQIPDHSGEQVVVSLSRLNRIREIDPVSNTVVAEAGVVLDILHQAADVVDRLFPLSLASQGSCQIGGNLSSNAGGTSVVAYGNARELCLGVEVVLSSGEVLDDLRKLKKDNTGYDLKNLFVGAEGTLGIITAAVLKLFPRPKSREVAWVGLESPDAALALLDHAQDLGGSALTTFELIGHLPMEFAMRHIHDARPPLEGDWAWQVLIEFSSSRSVEDARTLMEDILSVGFEAGYVGDAAIAASVSHANEFRRLREMLPETQKAEGASIKHDISVPIASIPAFIEKAVFAVASVCPEARVVCFGHMGDGNLHYNISQPVGMDGAEFLLLYRRMNDAVHDVVRRFNGSISAEHGIGQLKREELIATASPVAIDLMRRVKAAFDPVGIMNPGKVI